MMQVDAPDNADAIALPPLIYGAALAIGLVLHLIYPIAFLPQRLAVWVGVALIVVSIVIVGSALRVRILDVALPGDCLPGQHTLARSPTCAAHGCHPTRSCETRRALFGGKVWTGLRPVQEASSPVDLVTISWCC